VKKMPTPQHHLSNLLGGMFHTAADRAAFVAAGVVGTASLWKDKLQEVNEIAVLLGPTLAAIFVASKIILAWIEIAKSATRRSEESDVQ
jgi:hypothetical protein